MTRLLDVNVLLALAWPNHPHHETATAWFEQHGNGDWATCLLTQSAFVRLSLNPHVTQAHVGAESVVELLSELLSLPGHRFLPDAPSLVNGKFSDLCTRIVGYRQVADAALLHVAAFHGATLVTFDGGIESVASQGGGVEVLRKV